MSFSLTFDNCFKFHLVFLQFDMAFIQDKAQDWLLAGFVRTIVMRFFQGDTILNPHWNTLIGLAQNLTNNTNLTSLDDFPEGILVGEPIIGLLEPKDMFEEGQRGVPKENTNYTSTMIEV